jgi:hypothetical protein
MAKKQLRKYSFTPGAAGVGYVVVEGKQDQYKLLLITNVTRGVILYNFADTQNTAVTVTYKPGGIKTTDLDNSVVTYDNVPIGSGTVGTAVIQNTAGQGETTITFDGISTTGHSANDELSIFVEEAYQMVRAWNDFGTDAIERQRVANPQSQIDADFEYGLQATKWQGFELVNQYPSVYEIPGSELTLSDITSDNQIPSLITVTTGSSHGLTVNDPITVQGIDVNTTGFTRAQGTTILASGSGSTFTYYAKGQVTPLAGAGTSILSPRSIIRKGGFYSGANLSISQFTSNNGTPSSVTITFNSSHGFVPGMPLLVGGSPTFNSNQFTNLIGSYYANSIPTPSSVQFVARGLVNIPGAPVTPDGSNLLTVYTRNDGFFTHRPGDGGVLMGTASSIHGASTTRQSKKYFRYQSGKGLLYTTGVLFAPNYDITSIVITNPPAQGAGVAILRITTAIPHGCQIGAVVRVTGCVDTEDSSKGFNAQYTVLSVESDVQLNVYAAQLITGSAADIAQVPKLYMYQWNGACIRTGPHDDANGMFFEYDGQNFNVVKRTSTLQLAGTVTFTPDSNALTGIGSLWTNQLKIGDRVVIKGMVHKVNFITSATSISVTPDYRGATTTSGNYMWKVQEVRVKQADFNYDPADGTGPSGYKMDPNHMQMIGIQFTWYGAGFMDFMVRGTDGNFIILHRMKQNNVNVTASMRSANLPVRYEVNNEASNGVVQLKTEGGLDPASSSCAVSDASFLPDSGFIYMNYELIKYNSVNRNDLPFPILNSLTRCAAANVFIGGSYRTIHGRPTPQSHASGSGIELVSLTASPNMSHWGSSYIMDGGFDLDRGYAFSYTRAPAPITSTQSTAFGIRLAPSASNGLVGDLGVRELLNRAQLLLQNIDVTVGNAAVTDSVRSAVSGSTVIEANSAILVQGILNPGNYSNSETWTVLNNSTTGNQPSFTQIATVPSFSTGTTASPGEKIFEFIASPGQLNQLDLTGIKELTQSAVGGRGTFPNGSDTLYITLALYPTGTTPSRIMGNVSLTLRWNEAQA